MCYQKRSSAYPIYSSRAFFKDGGGNGGSKVDCSSLASLLARRFGKTQVGFWLVVADKLTTFGNDLIESRQVVCEKLILFNLLVDTPTRKLSNLKLKAASFFMPLTQQPLTTNCSAAPRLKIWSSYSNSNLHFKPTHTGCESNIPIFIRIGLKIHPYALFLCLTRVSN